jgi:sugar-specific transcriptional regulator TrmB
MKQLGLSEAECSVYFSLLSKPKGEAIDLALARSKSASRKTEEAIKSLVDKRLVRIVSNKLEAAEPKIFIARIQESKRHELTRSLEELTNNTTRLLSILEPHYWEARLGVKPEDLLEPLPSLEEMEVKTAKVIASTLSQVSISAETFSWYSKVREEAYRALERGVKFRVLMVAKDVETVRRANEIKNAGIDVRHPREDWYPVRGTLGDNRELVFLIWAAREGGADPAKYFRPHYSRNPGMIRVFADAFEKRWSEARTV